MSKQRSFVDVLSDLDDQKLVDQLSALWPEVVKKVKETNKSGSLTLTLSADLDRGRMVIVSAKVTTKMPAPATAATIFYTDEDGNVTRNDPQQLPLKNVTPLRKQPADDGCAP